MLEVWTMSNDAQKLRSIFLAAVENYPPDQWPAYLDEACSGNETLRQRVEALLRGHAESHSMLDQAGSDPSATQEETILERPGTVIGPYKLLEEIGEGGFGVVFMAEQQHPLRRKVALKVIKPGMDTRQVIARFEAERQALALMDHPNIARVFDAGATGSCPASVEPSGLASVEPSGLASVEPSGPASVEPSGRREKKKQPAQTRRPDGPTLAGRPYFVMELVRGLSMTDYCDQHNLPVRERLELFIDVCQAVQHAHQKGIIHRDIKPSNVLVTLHDGKPVVKVIDFGIAKAMGQQLTEKTLFTNFAQMIGTPLYMSPEQAEMSGLDIDTRGDIYSLGVLLYELLTGTTPFEKDRFRQAGFDEIRRIIREEDPPKPSTRMSTVGQAATTASTQRQSDPGKLSRLFRGELDWIVMKALEKDRNRRYETASAFAADVQRYLNDEPVQACPPTAWYRFRKFARRNRGVLTTASALAVAILVGVGSLIGTVTVLAESNAQIKESNAQITQQQKETENALGREKQVNDDLLKSLERETRTKYGQNIQLADRELLAENVGRAEELLDDCPISLRGWEWDYLKRRRYRKPVTFGGHQDWVCGVALSPDGTRAVSGSAISLIIGDLKVWDTATGKTIRTLIGHKGPVSGVAFSGDGNSIASAGWDRTVRLWDVSTWKERHKLEGHTNYVGCVAISPDSQLVASGSGDRTVKLWDATTGQEVRTLRGHGGGLICVAFSPDGRSLASASHETIRIWDVATGKEVHTLRGHAGAVLSVAYSRDGRRLASAGFDGSVKIWDATSGEHTRTIRGDVFFAMSVAFNRDGTRLAVGSWDKTIKLWDPETGQEVLTLRDHTDMVTGVAFSQDGRLLASASLDGSVKVWDATPWSGVGGGESLLLRGEGDAALYLLYSPDGRHLASAGFDGVVKLWDPLTDKEVTSLGDAAGPVFSLAFSRNGQRLASASIRGVVKLWDVAAGKELATFRGNLGSATLSPDGRRVAWSRDGGFVEIRDTESGRQLLEFYAHPAPVIWVSYSPDGKQLVTAGWDKTARVWDATTGAEVLTLSGHKHVVQFAVFSPDGKRVATASWDHTAKVWDASTGKEIFTLRGHKERVGMLAFSPDGKFLATASFDNSVKIWDGRTGKELLTLPGHAGYVSGVAFSPDSKRLATAGGYRGRWEIKIWDATQWDEKRESK
jgi:WD40 repeat protein/serine/threonine protein kinase